MSPTNTGFLILFSELPSDKVKTYTLECQQSWCYVWYTMQIYAYPEFWQPLDHFPDGILRDTWTLLDAQSSQLEIACNGLGPRHLVACPFSRVSLLLRELPQLWRVWIWLLPRGLVGWFRPGKRQREAEGSGGVRRSGSGR